MKVRFTCSKIYQRDFEVKNAKEMWELLATSDAHIKKVLNTLNIRPFTCDDNKVFKTNIDTVYITRKSGIKREVNFHIKSFSVKHINPDGSKKEVVFKTYGEENLTHDELFTLYTQAIKYYKTTTVG